MSSEKTWWTTRGRFFFFTVIWLTSKTNRTKWRRLSFPDELWTVVQFSVLLLFLNFLIFFRVVYCPVTRKTGLKGNGRKWGENFEKRFEKRIFTKKKLPWPCQEYKKRKETRGRAWRSVLHDRRTSSEEVRKTSAPLTDWPHTGEWRAGWVWERGLWMERNRDKRKFERETSGFWVRKSSKSRFPRSTFFCPHFSPFEPSLCLTHLSPCFSIHQSKGRCSPSLFPSFSYIPRQGQGAVPTFLFRSPRS